MSSELIKDKSRWMHKAERYIVVVEDSAPKGVTQFRREVALPSGSRRLRTKQTRYFLREFVKA